jgi:2-keto-4-pentenoate hydratase/2-oxohepta-3-ene-1,7-dioic acid hydratase in catechol pathway
MISGTEAAAPGRVWQPRNPADERLGSSRPQRAKWEGVVRDTFRLVAALCLGTIAGCADGATQEAATPQGPPAPYKLGMFSGGGRPFVGMIVADTLVLDLARAGVNAPSTLKELIAGWDEATAGRLGALAGASSRQAPAYALRLSDVRTLPPISDPEAILMAARNYAEHADEMAKAGRALGTTTVVDEKVRAGIPGLWSRSPEDSRGNPYLFPKLKSSLIATGDPILLPPGREHIDFECELVAVIGRPARRVSVDRALDYVFGYMAMTDVSDREDRADGRYGSDWLISKSHDTFGPSGPYIAPAAFAGDPQNLRITYTLNGAVMQDDSTALMIHTVRDLVAYASSIATLSPGDLIGTGTPGGVGEARVPPVYLKPGDTSVCSIEGIGTLTNRVEAVRQLDPTP